MKGKDNDRLPLPKCRTGIDGLDQITEGGLPRGRTTLVCGSAGCGKTLMGTEFLMRGATEFGEPGVLMAFEETAAELSENVRSLSFDLDALVAEKRLVVDHVRVERSEIEETGEYDLEGLFIRLGYAIDSIGAKRVVLDTVETLFSGLSNQGVLRAELRRLFRWLKDKQVTSIVTGERGEGTLTRHGLEEYVSDCVILLDHRAHDQVSTRRLRIVKYRGSTHGTNEYPFLIDEEGISVMPVTSLELRHTVSEERISTGIPRLDEMLGGEGFYRGTSVLISGTAGTGKTTLACQFADAACRRGEACLYFAFEESPDQLLRNQRSVGLDLRPWVDRGLLQFHASRPTFYGLEMHLAVMHKLIEKAQPGLVIVDPMSNFLTSGTGDEARSMLMRLIDYLKGRHISALFNDLTTAGTVLETTGTAVSSLMDTWILLRDVELGGERNRTMYVLKSRGMAHSNQLREYRLTGAGVEVLDVYLGPEGVLTGSMRVAQEARERSESLLRQQDIETRRRAIERRRAQMEARIAALRLEFEEEEEELSRLLGQQQLREQRLTEDRADMARSRKANGQMTESVGALKEDRYGGDRES